MFPVIRDACQNLSGPRQRCTQPHGGKRLGMAIDRILLQRGAPLLKVVDNACIVNCGV
jgi:hypothetical protein